MRPRSTQSNLLLLTAAVIWGFSFVAQRVGMGTALTGALRVALMKASSRV